MNPYPGSHPGTRLRAVFLALLGAALLAPPALGAPSRLTQPLLFEENRGQAGPGVAYLARGGGRLVLLAPREAALSLGPAVVRMAFQGADPLASLAGEEPLAGVVNDWHRPGLSGIPTCAAVRCRNLYPGIDLRYHDRDGSLEYDFILKPGAHPESIRMAFRGAASLRLDAAGTLVLRAGGRELREPRPTFYQEGAGGVLPVRGGFRLLGRHSVGFQVSAFDPALPLVIDPLVKWGPIAAQGTLEDPFTAVAVDGAGAIYLAGQVHSLDYAFLGKTGTLSGADGCLIKLRPDGTLVYLDILPKMLPTALALGSGAVFLAGDAAKGLTLAGFQPLYGGGGLDGFVARADAADGSLKWSTYLGGAGEDHITAMAVDAQGSVLVAGSTTSTHFHGAPFGASGGGREAFAAQVSTDGTALQHFTYLGGKVDDAATGLALGPGGSFCIAGTTRSPQFPLRATAFTFPPPGPEGLPSHAFLTRFNADWTLAFSTCLKAHGHTFPCGVQMDAQGNIYVAGTTDAEDFPTTPGAYLRGFEHRMAFVTKLGPEGDALIFSTFLPPGTTLSTLAVDERQNVLLGGQSTATALEGKGTPNALAGGGSTDPADPFPFVARLGAAGDALDYSGYLGTSDGAVKGLALGSAGALYVVGDRFPLHQKGFAARVDEGALTPVIRAPQTITAGTAGHVASVPSARGHTYHWTLPKGLRALKDPGDAPWVAFAADSAAGPQPLTIACRVTGPEGAVEATRTLQVEPVAPPGPAILVAAVDPVPFGGSTTITPRFSNGAGVVDEGIGPVVAGVPFASGVITSPKVFTLKVTNASPVPSLAVLVVRPETVRMDGIMPALPVVLPGAATQFHLRVTGGVKNTVTWSASVGTMIATGLWIAPVLPFVVATITAISEDDPGQRAVILVLVMAPNPFG